MTAPLHIPRPAEHTPEAAVVNCMDRIVHLRADYRTALSTLRTTKSRAMRTRANDQVKRLGDEIRRLEKEEWRLRRAAQEARQAGLVQHMPAISGEVQP